MRATLIRTAALTLWAIHATGTAAWAQKLARPPEPEGGMLKVAVAVGLGIVICGSGFLAAKRSHLT